MKNYTKRDFTKAFDIVMLTFTSNKKAKEIKLTTKL